MVKMIKTYWDKRNNMTREIIEFKSMVRARVWLLFNGKKLMKEYENNKQVLSGISIHLNYKCVWCSGLI